MAEASLKLGGDWGVKEGSLLGFNDQNGNYKPIPFDFTRATTATRVNRDGLIEEVQEGVPRIDFLDNPDGSLLLEPQRTNSITYSEDFSDGSWLEYSLGSGINPVVTSNYAISPEGVQNASRLQLDAVGTGSSDRSRLYTLVSTTSGTDYTFSFYAKSNTGNNEYIKPRAADINYSEITITTEWQRFDVSFTAISTGSLQYGFEVRGNHTENSADILIYGAQLEAGSYATSYIKTSGSAVTRNADACNNAETTFNDSEGVLYAEFKSEDTTNYKLISISDGTDNNRVFLGTRLTTGYIYYFVVSGGSTQASYITTDLASDFTKVAVKYKANDFALWINGTEVSTDSSGSTPIGLDVLQFNGGSGTLDFHGNCKEVRVYNTALTDTELQELTTI